jgi:hypothetical protein
MARCKEALRAATPILVPTAWIDDSVLAGEAEQLFARACRDGLDSLTFSERRGRLPGVIGQIAEAVAARVMDGLGFTVFAQLTDVGARGADLLLLSPADRVLVAEVKGTLRPRTVPRLRRSRLEQMSAPWLDQANAPMMEWGLEARDVYGGVIAVDVGAAEVRLVVTADFATFVPVTEPDALDPLLSSLG